MSYNFKIIIKKEIILSEKNRSDIDFILNVHNIEGLHLAENSIVASDTCTAVNFSNIGEQILTAHSREYGFAIYAILLYIQHHFGFIAYTKVNFVKKNEDYLIPEQFTDYANTLKILNIEVHQIPLMTFSKEGYPTCILVSENVYKNRCNICWSDFNVDFEKIFTTPQELLLACKLNDLSILKKDKKKVSALYRLNPSHLSYMKGIGEKIISTQKYIESLIEQIPNASDESIISRNEVEFSLKELLNTHLRLLVFEAVDFLKTECNLKFETSAIVESILKDDVSIENIAYQVTQQTNGLELYSNHAQLSNSINYIKESLDSANYVLDKWNNSIVFLNVFSIDKDELLPIYNKKYLEAILLLFDFYFYDSKEYETQLFECKDLNDFYLQCGTEMNLSQTNKTIELPNIRAINRLTIKQNGTITLEAANKHHFDSIISQFF